MQDAPPLRISADEIKTIGRIINNLSFVGAQLVKLTRPGDDRRSRANLKLIQKYAGALVKRLDDFAAQSKDAQVRPLIEDLDRTSDDAVAMLNLACRCMYVSAFLAHCLAIGECVAEPAAPPADLKPASAGLH